jgi:hypothetical protein
MEWLNRLMFREPMVNTFQMMKVEIDEQLMKNIARKQMVIF